MAGDTYTFTKEQQGEGYWAERSGEYVLVWHNKNQIALLAATEDIEAKIQDVVERRRKTLREIDEKMGTKQDS